MSPNSPKTCFVTIGATASFSSLIKTVLSAEVCKSLESLGYSRLLVQYGSGGKDLFDGCVKEISPLRSSLGIDGFDLDKSGLSKHMREAKGRTEASEGVVISHAGIYNNFMLCTRTQEC